MAFNKGIEFLELIYGQLRGAGIIRSKGEFSERLLGKSPSYLTSTRAKHRAIANQVIVGLGDNLMVEITEIGPEPTHAETRAVLRRSLAQVNNYLADQTMPAGISPLGQTSANSVQPPTLMAWLRVLGSILISGSMGRASP